MIEVAIALVVIGAMLSILVPTVKTLRNYVNFQKDQQKYERICYALAAYVVRYKHLPMPAKDTLGESCDGDEYLGFIPYKTIGLNRDDVFDSNGRVINYVVDKYFTTTEVIDKTGSTSGLIGMLGPPKKDFCTIELRQDVLTLGVTDYKGESVVSVESGFNVINPLVFVLFAKNKNVQVSVYNGRIDIRMLNNNVFVKYIFRDELMFSYARCPCGVQNTP